MKIIEKPWGKEELLEHNSAYMVKKLTMYKGHKCSLQLHKQKIETIYVLSGQLQITLGDREESLESRIYHSGEYITISANRIHRMEAIEESVYLEASTPELEDVVRLEDAYKRV